MSLPLPRPGRGDAWSLFLDFDGTLTEIAETPDTVAVDGELREVLMRLRDALGGALAVVSGRPIAELDALLAPATLALAGLHGLEWRARDGRVSRRSGDLGDLGGLRDRLAPLAAADERIVLEDKGLSLALHYRRAPEREHELRELFTALVGAIPGYHVLEGKMVLEAKPESIGKGHAIEALMAAEPFRGRRPVFAGDDVTDEDGFAVVESMGGISIKVGKGKTRAQYRTDSVASLLAWLRELPGYFAADPV